MMHKEMFLFCIGTAEGGVWSIYGGRRKKLAVEELRESIGVGATCLTQRRDPLCVGDSAQVTVTESGFCSSGG